MRIFLVVLTLSLAACGGSGSSSSKPDSKPQTSGNSSTNAIPQKNALALDKFPVSDLQQVTFQSLDSSSIPAIKTFD